MLIYNVRMHVNVGHGQRVWCVDRYTSVAFI